MIHEIINFAYFKEKGCAELLQEPKMFISTTPFYYIEVEKQEEKTYLVEEQEEKTYLEESTSVYEINRTERVNDLVIARQLNYFSQPANSRTLLFHMKNGESHIGLIQEYKGKDVKIKTAKEEVVINGNEIDAITISKSKN